MKKKIQVEKHGDYYVPHKEVLVCPECGMSIEEYEKVHDGEWLPLEICYWNEESLKAECPNCHCEFSRIQRRYINDINFQILIGVILLITSIVFLILCIYNIVVNPEAEGKIVGDFVIFIASFFIGGYGLVD